MDAAVRLCPGKKWNPVQELEADFREPGTGKDWLILASKHRNQLFRLEDLGNTREHETLRGVAMLVQLGRQNRARWLPQRRRLFADDPFEPRHCECAHSQEQALLGVTPEPAVLVACFLTPWVRGRLELRECQPWQEAQTSDERSRRSAHRPWSSTSCRALDGRCKQWRRRTIQPLWSDECLSEPARAFHARARIFEGGGELAYVFLEAPRKNQQPASSHEQVVKMNRAFLIVRRDFRQHDR